MFNSWMSRSFVATLFNDSEWFVYKPDWLLSSASVIQLQRLTGEDFQWKMTSVCFCSSHKATTWHQKTWNINSRLGLYLILCFLVSATRGHNRFRANLKRSRHSDFIKHHNFNKLYESWIEYKTLSSGLLFCNLRLYLLAFLPQWNRIVLKINTMDFVSNVSVMLTERSDHIASSWHSLERECEIERDRQTEEECCWRYIGCRLTELIVYQHRCESGGKGRRGELATL